jgi:hypothetical protein
MNLLEQIPKGKRNRVSMEWLMIRCNLSNKDDFKRELRDIKQDHIVLFDNGYFIPEGDEIKEFIIKCNERKQEIQHLIELANKLMK